MKKFLSCLGIFAFFLIIFATPSYGAEYHVFGGKNNFGANVFPVENVGVSIAQKSNKNVPSNVAGGYCEVSNPECDRTFTSAGTFNDSATLSTSVLLKMSVSESVGVFVRGGVAFESKTHLWSADAPFTSDYLSQGKKSTKKVGTGGIGVAYVKKNVGVMVQYDSYLGPSAGIVLKF